MVVSYPYPRPSATVDAIVLRPGEKGVEVLLIRRGHPPFAGRWALPGGFLEMDETPLSGALRELHEETGISGIRLRPLFTAAEPGRDPRGRCLTMVFGALVDGTDLRPTGADDATEAKWFPMDQLPEMAFDHDHLLAMTGRHLRWQAQTAIIGWQLWPKTFTCRDLAGIAALLEISSPVDDMVTRGLAAGVLSVVADDQTYRFLPSNDMGCPEWHPLVW